MGGIFGGGAPSGPGPEYYASLKRQEENLKRQEELADKREREERQKLESQKRSRRTGGFQLLLSDREDAEEGLADTLSGIDPPAEPPTGAI